MSPKIKKGKNLEDIQQMNRALVISLLRKKEISTRVDLAKATGLKQATITNIINDLIDCGLVVETGIVDGKKGRRSIGLTINGVIYKVVSVRLERKHFTVGLYDMMGVEYEIIRENINMMSGSKKAVELMIDTISKVIKNAKDSKIIGIGVAIPGPFLRRQGKIVLVTEFPGWEEISIKEELKSNFKMPIYVEHDANLGALAEWWFGSNFTDTGTMVYVAAGQGLGAGVINDGKSFTGAMGIAGEIGHMSIDYNGPKCECGNVGCLEHYCSTITMLKEVEAQLKNYPHSILNKGYTLKDFFKALEAEDELAKKVFEKTARYLGLGLVNVIYVYNPHVIVLGDELAQGGELLLDIVSQTIKEHVMPSIYNNLTIQLSKFKNDPALVGASSLVIDNIKDILSISHSEE